MSENTKNWWEKVAIIATLTIALTGLTRLIWDSTHVPKPIDSTLQQYAQQNQLLQQQQLTLLKRLDAMEKEQLKANQAALESKLQALTAQLTATANPTEAQTTSADTTTAAAQKNQRIDPSTSSATQNVPNVSGTWKNVDGSATYTLAQNAKKITLREERTTQQGKLTTAVGEGYIEDNQLQISFTTIFETTGNGTLNIVDEKTLKGSLTNSTNGTKEDVVLNRN
jgi:hypothetical protein